MLNGPLAQQRGQSGGGQWWLWVVRLVRGLCQLLRNDTCISQGPAALGPTSVCGLIRRLSSQVPGGSRQKPAAALANRLRSLLFVQHRCNLAPAQINLFSHCQVQILEMPSKTSVCTLKPEAGAKPGMPMCLELWQVRPSACQPHPPATPARP